MKTLQISSVPMMELLQKACEGLVIHNTSLRRREKNPKRREKLLAETNEAVKMEEHLRRLIRENLADH